MKQIEEIAYLARRILQDALLRCMNKDNTKGACLYGAHLVHTMISQFTSFHSIVRGGDGKDDGGFFNGGVGSGHYWVEVETTSGAVIVDITADQFGVDALVVKPLEDAKYYRKGNQDVVDKHYGEFMLEIGRLVPCDFAIKE
ncbi:hypothetical protein NFT50_001248 [Salmonella enterica]|nr:hypothetical protein [Salmonella enterica]EJH7438207.1 hypothetical protein [Salmonella enterica]EJH7877501.1 hypothetical protein [Salmonella enterica]EJI6710215.1 hypothetical protein [Salmonella enterica]